MMRFVVCLFVCLVCVVVVIVIVVVVVVVVVVAAAAAVVVLLGAQMGICEPATTRACSLWIPLAACCYSLYGSPGTH